MHRRLRKAVRRKCKSNTEGTTASSLSLLRAAMTGTASVKYNPVVEAETDDSDPNLPKIENIKYICISAMEEYKNKSLDELRLEDYLAHRRGPGFAFSSSAFHWRPQNTPFGDTIFTAMPSDTTLPPLTFHSVHDVNARVSGCGTKAERVNSFDRAIVFSSRPVEVNEKVYIRLVTVSSDWNGNIGLGFTSDDPTTFFEDFKYPFRLTKPGCWAGPVDAEYCEENVILYYYFNSEGQIKFGVNGEEKGTLHVGIDVEKTLFAVVDIYANCTCVQLVNPKNLMHNLQETGPAATPSDTILPPLTFHSVHDVNARVFGGGTKARRVTSFNRAIVFSSRPVKVNEKVYIRLVTVSSNWNGNIGLGFTSDDPTTFFEDFKYPFRLNKPGCWVGPVDAEYCEENVILYYYFNSEGQIKFGVNGEEKGMLHVGIDVEKTLSAVVDIYANCTCVQLVNPKNLMHHLQETGTFRPQLAIGTALARYVPVVGTDVVIQRGTSRNITVKHHCITVMKQYEEKSLEELRLEDYSIERKGPVKFFGQIQWEPEHTSVFGGIRLPWLQQTWGTALAKYIPVLGTDVIIKSGTSRNITVNHHCITVMKEYEEKSLEELRLEDYSAGRKGPQKKLFGQIQWQPDHAPVFGGTSSVWEQQTMGTASEKFVPTEEIDFEVKGHHPLFTHSQKKYKNKSLEELRLEDYSANRKGPATVFGRPDLLSENKTPFSPFNSEKSFKSGFSQPKSNNDSSTSLENTNNSGQKGPSRSSTAPNFEGNPFSNVSFENFFTQLKNNNKPSDLSGNKSENGRKDQNLKGNPSDKLASFENFFSQARTQNEKASSKFSDKHSSGSSSGPQLKQIPLLKPISFESLFSNRNNVSSNSHGHTSDNGSTSSSGSFSPESNPSPSSKPTFYESMFSQSRRNNVSSNSHGNTSDNGSTSRNSSSSPDLKPLPYLKPVPFMNFYNPLSFFPGRTAGDFGNSRNSSTGTQRNTTSGNIPDRTKKGTTRTSSGKSRKDGKYTSTPEDFLRQGVERVSISGSHAEQILDRVRAAHNTSETTAGSSGNATSNPSSINTSSGTSGTFTNKFRSNRPSSSSSGNNTSTSSSGQQATGSSRSGNPTSSSSSDQQPGRRYTDDQMNAVRRVENARNNYNILGVPAGSNRATIEAAHSKLKKLLHPDKNKAPGSREAFVKLNKAASELL